MSDKIVLLDGHSILNRAFYRVPDLSNAEGLHTNAVYGFLNILFKILDEEQPQYLAVAFDLHAPTFRHKMYDQYKGTRKPMPQELREQVPVIQEVLAAMDIEIVTREGYEADDILGTLGRKCEAEGMEVTIVSGDRDLLQLATDHILIRIPKTVKRVTTIENYHTAEVLEKYSLLPKQIIDLKALMGDTADNIPGLPGVGEKTATFTCLDFGASCGAGVFSSAQPASPISAAPAVNAAVPLIKFRRDISLFISISSSSLPLYQGLFNFQQSIDYFYNH